MLTLNIEDRALKITQLKGNRVLKAFIKTLDTGIIQNGVILDKEKISNLIKQSLLDNKIIEKEVMACVSGIQSIYRVVYLPKMDSGLLEEAAKLEMQKAIPVPLETLYTSWYPIKVSDLEMAICLIGIPRENLDSLIDTVKMSQLSLKYVELRPLSVARVVDDKTCIVLNVREDAFDLIISSDCIPEIIRSFPFNDRAMVDLDKINQIKDEIERTVSFYNSGHKTVPLNAKTSCFVSGYLRDGLLHALGYSVIPLPQPLVYPEGCDSNNFVANTGIAIRSTGKESQFMKVQVNAVSKAAPVKNITFSNSMIITAAIVCLLIAASAFWCSRMLQQENENSSLLADNKLNQVVELQRQIKAITENEKKDIETLRTQLANLNEPLVYLAQSRDKINYNLGKTISYLPGVIYLTNIRVDGSSIDLEGKAPDELIVYDYARELQQSGAFNIVLISSIENRDYNEIVFKIKLVPEH